MSDVAAESLSTGIFLGLLALAIGVRCAGWWIGQGLQRFQSSEEAEE